MRVKTEYLVLIAIIIAAAVYLTVHKQNGENYTLPKLPSVSVDDITRLVIIHDARTITLNKEGEHWKISPGDYAADDARVKGLALAMADLSVTALVSEAKAYARYDLTEDKRIRVSAFAGDRLLRSVDIGKEAPTFQHTFVKLPDDDNVYHAAGDFRRQFDRSADDLRDKVVAVFQPDKITAVTVETLTDEFQLAREPAAAEATTGEAAPAAGGKASASGSTPAGAWLTADGRELPGSAVEPLLSRINRLACSRFLDDKKPEDLGTPTLTVTIEGDKTISLQIYPALSGIEDSRPAVSSEVAQPFLLPSWQVESMEETIGTWRGDEKKETGAAAGKNPPAAE